MATVAYPIRAPPSTRGRVDRARGTVLYRPAMEQARVLAASRRMFIDGKWVEASNGATYPLPNPATEEPIGTAPDATVDDMKRAIAAARRAFDDGPWPHTSRQDRARVLTAIADGMERRKEELRQLVIAEAGATYLTHDIQIEQPIRMMRHYAELALTFDFEEPLPTRVSESMLGTQVNSGIVYRHPAGVCGLIPHLELPALRDRAEARPRARDGLHDGLQTLPLRAAHQPLPGRDRRRGRPAARRGELRHRAVECDRGDAGLRPAHRQGELHGQRRHREEDHGGGGEDLEARPPGARRQVGRHLPRHRQPRLDRAAGRLAHLLPRRTGLRHDHARPPPARGARHHGAEDGRLRAGDGEDRRPGRPGHVPRARDPRGAAAKA